MIALDDDPSRLQFDRIHAWLAASYWSPRIERALVERAAAGSHCLGAYAENGAQIGYARVVSDRATFAWIADVIVDESARGQGLGRRMVRFFLDHPGYVGLRRFMLATWDAHEVYRPLGFAEPRRPDRLMERLSAEGEALMRRGP